MAVTRPLKEGSVTTYQQKVALGFPDILASEMDADLDTIYAAWNGGVATANLVDGSVTFAKLAPDAQLWRDTGTTLVPGTSFATRIVAVPGGASFATVLMGTASVKGRVQTSNANGAIGLLSNRDWTTNAQDDATKPSWSALLNPVSDNFQVQRTPAGSTAPAGLLTLDANSYLTLGVTTATIAKLYVAPRCAIYASTAGTTSNIDFTCNWDAPVPSYDQSQPGYTLRLGTGPGNDWLNLLRRTPNTASTFVSIMNVDSGGNLTIAGATATKASGTTWANPSDPRLKTDLGPYAAGLAEICRLDPITYRLKAQPDGPLCYGFDASAVREVLPECVSTTKMKLDPADEEETEDVLTFDMHPILVALVNAVKEVAARVAALETR
jgi:hypothetical protein